MGMPAQAGQVHEVRPPTRTEDADAHRVRHVRHDPPPYLPHHWMLAGPASVLFRPSLTLIRGYGLLCPALVGRDTQIRDEVVHVLDERLRVRRREHDDLVRKLKDHASLKVCREEPVSPQALVVIPARVRE